MRTTSTDFFRLSNNLSEALGIELTTNVWHKHYSVYTKGEGDSCQEILATGSTAREACDQIRAILNTLHAIKYTGGNK